MISYNLTPLERCALVYSEKKGKERVCGLNTGTMEKIFRIVENHGKKFCKAKGRCIYSK